MKTYLRLLSFARPIGKFAIPYILTTLLAVIFGTLNLALLIPLLETLFKSGADTIQHIPLPEFSLSTDYFKNLFYHYFNEAAITKGKFGTLEFVCIIIISSAF